MVGVRVVTREYEYKGDDLCEKRKKKRDRNSVLVVGYETQKYCGYIGENNRNNNKHYYYYTRLYKRGYLMFKIFLSLTRVK